MRHARSLAVALAASVAVSLALSPRAGAQEPRTIAFRFTPTGRAQLALWIERADGTFLTTVALTRAVALRGIGNRPGALQMNSGFRWPYGRREGVLPVWAHRRASAPGAAQFARVIYQDRTSEGWASRSAQDFSVDPYFCLSFREETTRLDALDAVSCASTFNSDKGRYVTSADVAAGYGEPWQEGSSRTRRALSLESLYPPRRDVGRCTSLGCYDHADVERYLPDTQRVMPELDAVTQATPVGGREKVFYFSVPPGWVNGDYVAWLEVNVEGDYNETFDDRRFPTPTNAPPPAPQDWDIWAMSYGFPYRGQPSVVYRVPFRLGTTETADAVDAYGYGSVDGSGPEGGALHAMDRLMTNDPVMAPGSGADRARLSASGYRFRVDSRASEFCRTNEAPGAVEGLTVDPVGDEKHSHEWAHLSFVIPDDDLGVAGYHVRVGTDPIVDEESFMRAEPANAASLESEELLVPLGGAPGTRVEVDLGGLAPSTHYYVGVRAYDACDARGPIDTAEVTTSEIHFTVVSPCFVATAAYGTPLAHEIGVLRRFRDRHLMSNGPGRAAVRAYYAASPPVADLVREHEALRTAARWVLSPVVALARAVDDTD